MCGLAGILSAKPQSDAPLLVQKAAALLRHRGPDDACTWSNEKETVHLGHQRLCIVDVSSAGAQPMHFANRYTVSYNGELYNHVELRRELETAGHRFQSHSDTEVVLQGYAAWGANCLQRFDGAFAFVIWDEAEQTLFAARDRFGEKPFYYCHNEDRFLFASEPKALWALGASKEVNTGMLFNFLTLGYSNNPFDPAETFYNNVHKLAAAHSLTYNLSNNEVSIQCYWQTHIDVAPRITEAEAVEELDRLFRHSIQTRLRSDVAIGTSLSGGLDSSSIVAYCAGEAAGQYSHKCFTASFSGFAQDELKHAAAVAKKYNLQQQLVTIEAAEVAGLMEKVIAAQDEPFSSASVLAQYKVFKEAKEAGVTVLLDGQGADELMAGYHRYYKWYWSQLYRSRKLRGSKELEAARALGVKESFGWKQKLVSLLPQFSASLLQTRRNKDAFWHPHLDREFAFSQKQNGYYATPATFDLNGALYFNTFVVGLEELLRLADRNSMAHSVEVRLPFLQHQLVEFLFTLPPHFKIKNGWTKWLLRKTVEQKLPPEIVWRKDKIGYEPPQAQWMQNKEVQERIITAKKQLAAEGILTQKAAEAPVVPKTAHEAGSYDWRYWSAAHLFSKDL